MADTTAIDEGLRRAVGSTGLAGVVATACIGDDIIYQGAFGTRDLATEAPMTTDTVLWIASMTKALTGACAMQLLEQGRLSLDGAIADIVPALRDVGVLEGFDDAGNPRLRAPKTPITLRHLLTHTSGFSYDMWNADIGRYMKATGTPGVVSCRNAALGTPLVADPGEQWEYGISIDWVGKVVEAVSGQTLGAYMQQHILAPLGMSDTGFGVGAAQKQRLARVHSRTPSGGLVPIDHALPEKPEFHMGGGGLYSTVTDYLRFTRMIMQGGQLGDVRVLRPETVALMSRNAMADVVCQRMKTAIPGATLDVDFVEGMKWGLSFLINPEPMPTGRSAGSLAWAGLANTYFWIDPVRRITGVFATQMLPFFDPAAISAFEGFETAIYRMAA